MLTMATERKFDDEAAAWKPDPGPVLDPDSPLFTDLEAAMTEVEQAAEADRERRTVDRIRRQTKQPNDVARIFDNRHDVKTELSLAIDGNEDDREAYVAAKLRRGTAGRTEFYEDSVWLLYRFKKPMEARRDYWGLALLQAIAMKLDAIGLLQRAMDFVDVAEAK